MRWMIAAFAALFAAGCSSRGEAPSPVGSSTPSADDDASAQPAASAPERATAVRALPTHEGGSIARAIESDALFVADEDHAVVRVVALPAEVKSKRVDFLAPGRPAQVLVTRDRLLVTIRQVGRAEGALLALRRKDGLELEEVGRVSLPADAWGIALTPDEKTVLVTSAWTHRLTAIDLAKLEVKWSADLAREPRGIAILPSGDRAFVSHLVGSDVTRIDGIGGKEPVVKRIELPASPLRSPFNTKLSASLGYAVVASPEGDRVYFPRHALGALGSEGWYGAGTVDVLSTSNESPLAPMRSAMPAANFVEAIAVRIAKNEAWGLEGTAPVVETKNGLNAPRAIAYRRKTRSILVANEGSDLVLEFDALAVDPTLVSVGAYGTARKVDLVFGVAEHGEAPSGIAVSEDEDTAYVFCRATDDVIVVDLVPDAHGYRRAPHPAISLGGADDDKALRIGRALFYDATNNVLSGGVSCAGCHPEGRDDGHVWHEAKITLRRPSDTSNKEEHFTNFFADPDISAIRARWGEVNAEGEGGFGYARQTPLLAGRLKAQGPYGWHGESSDLVGRILAGFSLHRWNVGPDNETMKRAYANQLAAFIREGLVPPPRVDKPLTEQEERGKAIFMSSATRCSTCHPPQNDYSDRTIVPFQKLNPPRGFADDPVTMYKVPSLLFVGGTPPYMHDGRFESLESLIEYNQDRMGKTAQLSAEERASLIAFLRTL